MYHNKVDLLRDFPELSLTDFGDFMVKKEFVESYEIIDFHCHLYNGAKSFVPKLMRKEHKDMSKSFFDMSCYPINIECFNFNNVLFTSYPHENSTLGLIETAYELSGIGGFYSAVTLSKPERMLRDMKLNNVSKAVVLQLNTPDCDSSEDMKSVAAEYNEFISFGSIHPQDANSNEQIKRNLRYGVRGWKIAPHVINENIDSVKTIELMKSLHETDLPIVSCSGLALPYSDVSKLPKKLRHAIESQDIKKFETLLSVIPDLKLTFAHGGLYQSDELIELMKKYPQTTADISTQPPENIKKFIENVGSERILYGTDYPAFNHAFPIVSVLRATRTEEERHNIFSLNAKRLLSI